MTEKKWKVFVFSPYDYGWEKSIVEKYYDYLRSEGCELIFAERFTVPTREDLLELGRDADAFIGVRSIKERIDEEVFKNAPNLRIIAKYTVGVDDVDLEAATRRGILVTNAPTEYMIMGVAENTVALMLALLKKIPLRDKFVRSRTWRCKEVEGVYIHNRLTVGFIGFGRIAREVNKLLEPWGVKRIAYDPYIPVNVFEQAGVKSVDLETLLRESDIVIILAALTRETYHMIDEHELRMMKKTAYLVNTARGAIINEKALIRALKEGWISGAALDVFEQEPPEPNNPLLSLENVILSPHCSAFNEAGDIRYNGVKIAVENVLKALHGDIPLNIVNPEALPKWIERFGKQRCC
ncbi:MAG: phosphoglycerate dehydrogenase [Candidatus Bathyarchaeia archaeon]